MPPLAQRNLFHDKVRLTVTLTGIVFAVVLIVVELGLFVGFTMTTSNLIDNSGAGSVGHVEARALRRAGRGVQRAQAVPGARRARRGGGARRSSRAGRSGSGPTAAGVGADRRDSTSDDKHGRPVEPGAGPRRGSEDARCGDPGRALQAEAWREPGWRGLRDRRTAGARGGIHAAEFARSPRRPTCSRRSRMHRTTPRLREDQTLFILVKLAPGANMAGATATILQSR